MQRENDSPSVTSNLDLVNIEGRARDIIQRHFSFFKTDFGISIDEFNNIAFRSGGLDRSQFDHIQGQSDNIFKMEMLLKTLFKKGEKNCLVFIKELSKRREFKDLIAVITSSENPCDIERRNDNVITREQLNACKQEICENLQITKVLDMLFEQKVITVDEHSDVQNIHDRPGKRQKLLQLIFEKEDSTWLHQFSNVLRITDNNLFQLLMYPEQRPLVRTRQNRTFEQIPNVPLIDFVGRLAADGTEGGEINAISDVDDIIEQCLETGVLDLWEGSIYFHLATCTPGVLRSIIDGKANNKVTLFLQQLFENNRKLLHHFGTKSVIKFSLEEKPADRFLDKKYGKVTTIEKKDGVCSECFMLTIRENYKLVLGEIEDDIIDDTLNKVRRLNSRKCSAYETNRLLANRTRHQKAVMFLQYVLANEDALMEFRKVFAFRSQVSLETFTCRKCSNKDKIIQLTNKRTFHFTFNMDEYERVQIHLVKSRLTEDKSGIPESQRMIRAMSLVDCPYPAFESYKVVVIGETERPSSGRTSFFQIARETHEKKLKFYQLPSILESKEGKEARSNSIAHFIACTSPGPNAFLLITDLCHQVDVSNLLRPYLNYFGPNITRFLVVMFITKESKLQSKVIEYIQHSPDCQAVLKQCENRFITFDKSSQDHQIPDIMNDLVRLIRQMLTQNKEQFYSNEMFRQSEKEIQRATELIENENQLAIRKYEEKIKTLKQSNAREKAAEQIISQQSFIDIVSSGAHFL